MCFDDRPTKMISNFESFNPTFPHVFLLLHDASSTFTCLKKLFFRRREKSKKTKRLWRRKIIKVFFRDVQPSFLIFSTLVMTWTNAWNFRTYSLADFNWKIVCNSYQWSPWQSKAAMNGNQAETFFYFMNFSWNEFENEKVEMTSLSMSQRMLETLDADYFQCKLVFRWRSCNGITFNFFLTAVLRWTFFIMHKIKPESKKAIFENLCNELIRRSWSFKFIFFKAAIQCQTSTYFHKFSFWFFTCLTKMIFATF